MSVELRKNACRAVMRGMTAALMVTVPGMALIALAAVFAALSDPVCLSINQALKLMAIFIGARRAVGPGGTRGFQLGAVVGLMYIALGYGICALWGGLMTTGWMLAIEFTLGLILGGLSGALTANLPSRPVSARKWTARA